MSIPRRQFLKGISATAGISACSPSASPGAGSIENIILVMMENRSFDHKFGALSLEEGRAVDGLQSGFGNSRQNGTWISPFPSNTPCLLDPPHGWNAMHFQREDGNANFVRSFENAYGESIDPSEVMGYLTRERVPVSYALADHYTLCERWFSSLLAGTWPNRIYAHAAQSQGVKTNDLPDGGLFSCTTIWHLLDEAGIDWGYYYTDLPLLALFGGFADRLRKIEDFYADAAAGRLPAVTVLEPGASFNDDHPPHHPLLGQLFISSIHNAIATSPQWSRSLTIVNYDESGGFFDHVVPGTAPDDRANEGFDQLGFRVPAMVFGPWVRQGYVSDTPFDHTSPLAHIENMFGLPSLTARDAAANDLFDTLDIQRLQFNQPLPPAELPIISLTEQEISAECEPPSDKSFTKNMGQPELQQALHDLGLGKLDRTSEMSSIGRFLIEKAEQLGACTIHSSRLYNRT